MSINMIARITSWQQVFHIELHPVIRIYSWCKQYMYIIWEILNPFCVNGNIKILENTTTPQYTSLNILHTELKSEITELSSHRICTSLLLTQTEQHSDDVHYLTIHVILKVCVNQYTPFCVTP
jgi:hypothetical protein